MNFRNCDFYCESDFHSVGTAHYLVLQSFAGTETVEYPDPEKCLNPIITCSNGKRCFPFYSTNHDKTLTIGFFASEEGIQ